MKIGVLMYTYNRTDDARINMEIIREVWKKNNALNDIIIVHTFNGEQEWWPEKYLEDELLHLPNPGHFGGAEILLNEGIKCFAEKYPDIDYVVLLASDTWLIKPDYLATILTGMRKEEKYLATCPWGTVEKDNMWNIGMAIDFCVVNIKWAVHYGLFPIRFNEFAEKYSEIFYYQDQNIFLERVFALRFKQAVLKFVKLPSENLLKKAADSYVYRMREREPVHDEKRWFGIKKGRKMCWPNIGLLTQHEPQPKKDILKKSGLVLGKNAERLVQSTDLSYYNHGARKTIFTKSTGSINYE